MLCSEILGCDPAEVNLLYPHWTHKTDKLGRPVLFEKTADCQVDEVSTASTTLQPMSLPLTLSLLPSTTNELVERAPDHALAYPCEWLGGGSC